MAAKSPARAVATVPVGGYLVAEGDIAFNEDRETVSIKVRNTGDRPVQVGSHFHFFEANRALEFDRAAAYGKRLNIASSTAIRFEPGDERQVSLVAFGGTRRLCGFNNLVDGEAGDDNKAEALARANKRGFKSR